MEKIIRINEADHKRIKIMAARRGKSIKQFISDVLPEIRGDDGSEKSLAPD